MEPVNGVNVKFQNLQLQLNEPASSSSGYEFGFVPRHIVTQLKDVGNWRVRGSAIEELQSVVRQLDDSRLFRPYLSDLIRFILALLDDTNFKISLTTLQILGSLIRIIGRDLEPYTEMIIPKLVEKWGDNKIVVRQATTTAMASIARALKPQPVLLRLFPALKSENFHIREEIVNFTIFALSTFEANRLDIPALVIGLLPTLTDKKLSVKYVAIEACAVVHNIIGDRIYPLLSSIKHQHPDTYALLVERFANTLLPLPHVNSDGIIEHTSLSKLQRQIPGSYNNNLNYSTQRYNSNNTSNGYPTMNGNSIGIGPRPDFSQQNKSTIDTRRMLPEQQQQQSQQNQRDAVARAKDSDHQRIQSASRRVINGPTYSDDLEQEIEEDIDIQEPETPTEIITPRRQFSMPSSVAHSNLSSSNTDSQMVPSTPKGPNVSNRPMPRIKVQQEMLPDEDIYVPSQLAATPTSTHAGRMRDIFNTNNTSNIGSGTLTQTQFQREGWNAPQRAISITQRQDQGSPGSPSRAYNSATESFANSSDEEDSEDTTKKATSENGSPIKFESSKVNLWLPETSAPFKIRKPAIFNRHLDEYSKSGRFHAEPGSPLRLVDFSASNSSLPSECASPMNKKPPKDINPKDIAEKLTLLKKRRISARITPKNLLQENADEFDGGSLADTESTDSISSCASSNNSSFNSAISPTKNKPLTSALARQNTILEKAADKLLATTEEDSHSGSSSLSSRSGGGNIVNKKHVHSAPPGGQRGIVDISSSPLEEYTTEQLLPIKTNPAKEIANALHILKPKGDKDSESWTDHYEAINILRRITVHHSALCTAQLHDVVHAALEYVDSLRSLLAKNAIVCLNEMFLYLQKSMDTQLDVVVPMLLKKTSETNHFIIETAEAALKSMVENVSSTKALTTLMASSTHKNPTIRAKVAAVIYACLEITGQRIFAIKDLDRLLTVTVNFLNEGNSDARNSGRDICVLFLKLKNNDLNELEKFLLKHNLNDRQVKQFMEKAQQQQQCAPSSLRFFNSKMHSRSASSKSAPVSRKPSMGQGDFDFSGPSLGATSSLPSNMKRMSALLASDTPIDSNNSNNTNNDNNISNKGNNEQINAHGTVSITERVKGPSSVNRTKSLLSGGSSTITDNTNVVVAAAPPSTTLSTNRRPSAAAASSSASFTPESLEKLSMIYSSMGSNNWKEKLEGITSLMEMVVSHQNEFSGSDNQHLLKMFDHLIPRLSDPNNKVNVFALQSMQRIMPVVRDSAEQVLPRLLSALVNSLASSVSQIRIAGNDAFDSVCQNVDNSTIVQHLPGVLAGSGNPRVKGAILQKLCGVAEKAYKTKPSSVVKHVVPMCINLYQKETKADIRVANTNLLKTLCGLMGEQQLLESFAHNYKDFSHQELTKLKAQLSS